MSGSSLHLGSTIACECDLDLSHFNITKLLFNLILRGLVFCDCMTKDVMIVMVLTFDLTSDLTSELGRLSSYIPAEACGGICETKYAT